ncbi:MAG: BlaI/MecI/CopY family transcriptional regulator [Planctomycetaceae bacterium]
MARPASEHPTELELSILKILWQAAPKTVDQVRESLAENGRDLSHSSVITIMNIMVRKHYLKRKKNGRALEFTPLVEEDRVGRSMLKDLIHRVYDGSAQSLVLHLLETADVDTDELSAIRQLINRKAKELNQ